MQVPTQFSSLVRSQPSLFIVLTDSYAFKLQCCQTNRKCFPLQAQLQPPIYGLSNDVSPTMSE